MHGDMVTTSAAMTKYTDLQTLLSDMTSNHRCHNNPKVSIFFTLLADDYFNEIAEEFELWII